MFNIWFCIEVILVILKMNAGIMVDGFNDEILSCVRSEERRVGKEC